MIERDVVAIGVTVAGTHEPFVAGVDVHAPEGRVTLVPTDPGVGQVALALAIGGRVDLAAGSVAIAGSTERRTLQVLTRLVDVADVTAPEDALPVKVVVAEELALAERPSSRRDVADFLAERGLADRARDRWDSLPPGVRTRTLLELGSWHPEVRVVVLTGPDRHGGDPHEWYVAAQRLAERGLTVVVICSPATARTLAPATPTGDPA
ncbi:ABC transporter ATP-binding protein [Intrasporangium oryzae NRRL B-24470]|uniref:ABC transporter ATP-binding protein n=1 Tax=Intrasporangium oryzae NRRL B-24470 TaxID=1386089 RepID=W9GAH5_9MICO|nr:hypothetical protein [Intrasporangium oryzae]EWT02232.1 ABC transporter ATP-binding protein [Intrasporangium oryzae NRRL B-24470]